MSREDCKQLKNVDNIKIFGYGSVCGIRGFVCEIDVLKIIKFQNNYFHVVSLVYNLFSWPAGKLLEY